MSVQAFERPSIAKEFFHKIAADPDPVAAIKRLVKATPPVFETEWLDFKGADKITPPIVKAKWSESLAGFGNTQGGVLIWGVDARKDESTGIDAACGFSLVQNPSGLKSRLNELHHQATEPPVPGVEIEAYSVGGHTDEGFVVCFIPESPFKPHRAEHSNRQYIIRAGDDFVSASVSLLRNLFFPQSRCLLVPTFQARCVVKNGVTTYAINGFLKNTGSATAFDAFVITHANPVGGSYMVESWDTPILVPCNSSAKKPIHPGITTHFFATGYHAHNLANESTFRVLIFAQDAEPAEWMISFTEADMKTNADKNGVRRSLIFQT